MPFSPLPRKRTTSTSIEIDRIVGLPVISSPTSEELEEFSRREVEARHFERGFRLMPKQCEAVLAWDTYGGVFAPIPVGEGKTLVSLMIAARAYVAGTERSMLLVPSDVFGQLVRVDIPWARQRVSLPVPFHLLGNKSQRERATIARSGRKGCYVLPHSCMSTVDSTDLLTWIAPTVVLIDEAHKFKHADSARTRRLMTYINEHEPKLVALSGTMTSKSLRDYHHLLVSSLHESAPLPLSRYLMEQWAIVLDAQADPSDAHLGPVRPLVAWAQEHFPAVKIAAHVPGFRTAYKLRLRSAPGVVSGDEDKLGVSLLFKNLPVPEPEKAPGWALLQEKIDDVEKRWISPSGDEIEWVFHAWKHLWELSGGIYYRLVWPTADELRLRRGMTEAEAVALLEMAKAHHKALQAYHVELRKWFGRGHKAHLDTPMLVGASMAQHGPRDVGDELYSLWFYAKSLELPELPERDSVPVRVCDFKVQHAVSWAASLEKGIGCILWYHHQEVGRWLAERVMEANLDGLHCPAGELSNLAIVNAANKDRIVIASQSAHATGKNLQHFQEQLCVQFPRQADVAQQLIGRTHRTGQEADELIVHTTRTLEFDHQNFGACLNDALYTHQTLGTPHKLIYGTYDPLPKIYPSVELRELGFQNRILSEEESRALAERFG